MISTSVEEVAISTDFSPRNDDQKDNVRDVSPDISLSSGPIEPLGVDKDSGSDPESSHNDISPNHRYSLKDQHEWLKHHLKATISEKNKLEETAARLSEKSERLQYELADAKEATKSKDEVIKLLQEQLSRMETAYTKSLEECVHSRLQLTSHEQEILHLKEICYKYEEEKSREAAEAEAQHVEKLEVKIKRLEKEKEKMKEEILQLENERKTLVKRLKEATESEILDQCQRWKERCANEELKTADTVAHSKGQDDQIVITGERERFLQEQNTRLEKKLLEVAEENLKLRSDHRKIVNEVESKKQILIAKRQIDESIEELQKKSLEMESHVGRLEKDFKDKMEKILKGKETQSLMRRSNLDKELFVKNYGKRLNEWKFKKWNDERSCKEIKRLKKIIRDLRCQMKFPHVKKPFENDVEKKSKSKMVDMQNRCDFGSKFSKENSKRIENFDFLFRENMNLKQAMGEIRFGLPLESSGQDSKNGRVDENIKITSVIGDTKEKTNALSFPTEGDRGKRTNNRPTIDSSLLKSKKETESTAEGEQTSEEKQEREMATDDRSNGIKLCGMHSKCETIDLRMEKVKEIINKSESVCGEAVEIAKLKREVAFLRNKMAEERESREALENRMSEINRDIREKETLQREVGFLKKKISRDYIEKFNFELAECQKQLQSKRESYMESTDGNREIDEIGGLFNEDYKTKCKILAKEREKSKELRTELWWKNKTLDFSNRTHPEFLILANKESENFIRSQYAFTKPLSTLEPEMKNLLEKELVKSIRRYKKPNEDCPTKSV